MWTHGHEAVETQIRLNAILRTGGATSGRTAGQLDIIAQQLSETSRFDDTAIKQGMTAMLKFGSVHSEVFDKAMEVSAKYAESSGRSFQSASQEMGRALENIASGRGSGGLRGLEAQFGKLTKTQRDYIDSLIKLGDVTGAHTALLNIFDKKMGDVYKDMSDAGVNSVDKFKKAWKELMEELGKSAAVGGVWDFLINKGAESIAAWAKLLKGGMSELGTSIERRILLQQTQSADPAVAKQARMKLGEIDADAIEKGKPSADEEMRRDAANSAAIIAADKRAADLRAEEWKKGAAARKAIEAKSLADYVHSVTEEEKIMQEARELGDKFLKDQDDKRLLEEEQARQINIAGQVAMAQAIIDEDFRMTEQLARDQIDASKKMGEFAKEAARGIQRGFSDGLFDIMQGKFDNMGDRFKQMLDRMVADTLAAQLASKMFGDMDKTGNIGGWIGKGIGWLSGLGGGTQAPAPVSELSWGGAQATGGDYMVSRPTMFLAGESGPERATFSGAGKGDNKQGRSVQVVNNFTIQGGVDRRSQAQIAAAAGQGVQRALVRNT